TNAVSRAVDAYMLRLREGYRRTLGVCLKAPKKVLAASVVLFLVSLSLITLLKKEFIPSQDQGLLLVNLTLPLGVSLDHTDKVFKEQLEPWMREQKELDHYYCAIGGFTGGQV